jgi:ABC-2 type transport system permease protein
MTTLTPAAAPAAAPAAPGAIKPRAWLHTMGALLARDFHVLGRDIPGFVVRVTVQPTLFVFVFAVVLPKLQASGGGGIASLFGSTSSSAASAGSSGAPLFSTILVPGLVASAILFQGLTAVTAPLVLELSYTREIEDRVLAPIPVWVLAWEKIIAGAIQAVLAAIVVFPLVMVIHAKGEAPSIDFHQWPLLILVVVLAALFSSALALLLGTIVDPRRVSIIISIVIVPMTLLGCVYYPWSELSTLRWLQFLTLFNPLVYICEALRATLTPSTLHMPVWVLLVVLGGGLVLVTAASVRTFTARLVD